MAAINWELCCLSQDEKDASLVKDHGERFGLKVSWTQLDEGRGIAETIQAHMLNIIKCIKHTVATLG